MALAKGDDVLRERNHRAPNRASRNGAMKIPKPLACSNRSEPSAPTMPIQLRAASELVKEEALLNEGSTGEYEASARKRRAAETSSRKPISSFSRRLFVGTRARETYFMGVWHRWICAFAHKCGAEAASPSRFA